MSGKRQKISRQKLRALLLMAAGGWSLAFPNNVPADTDSWIGAAGGNWTDGSKWSTGAPTANQDVSIATSSGGTQTITYNYTGPAITFASLTVDATGGGSNVLSMPANRLIVSDNEYVGYNGAGNFNQAGGTHALTGITSLYLGFNAGSTGTYNLGAGASLSADDLSIEAVGERGTGVFTQTGGKNSLTNKTSFYLGGSPGSTGSYTLAAGANLSASNNSYEFVGFGGAGYFNQTGGTNSLFSSAFLLSYYPGAFGAYALGPGASLVANNSTEFVGFGGAGSFNQTGGTNSLTGGELSVGLNGTGTYTLAGSASLAVSNSYEEIGYSQGPGFFNQTGGSNALTDSNLYVGDFGGVGFYNQTGGANSITGTGTLWIASNAGSSGAYTLSGGSLYAAGAYVGGSTNAAGGVGSLTVSGAGQLAITGKLQIWNSGTVTLNGGASSATAGALQIAPGGNLVMNGPHNAFILNYGSAASPNSSIRQFLQNGYNGGNWDAGGTLPNPTVGAITSSTAEASNTFSLGYADGSDGVVAALSGGQEEIKFTYAGDANLDGQVNLSDLITLAAHFGSNGAQWDQGDFTYDGSVNLTDLIDLASHFGDGAGSPLQDAQIHAQFAQDLETLESTDPTFASEMSRLVPEPSSIALLAIAGIGLLKRRSRSVAKI